MNVRVVLLLGALSLTACGDRPEERPSAPGPSSEAAEPARSDRLRAGVPDTLATRAEVLLAASENPGGTARLLALEAFLNRHLDAAAWLYAHAVEADPSDGIAWSNLGLTLTELAHRDAGDAVAASSSGPPVRAAALQPAEGGLDDALAALRTAVERAPDRPEPHNNFGVAQLRAGRFEAAEASFRRALELESSPSGQALIHAHLAETYVALGRTEEAGGALARSHELDPFNGALIQLARSGVAGLPAPGELDRSYCELVNYDCMAQCPPSIIGRINAVTCEMANSSAQLACRRGEPYAPTYNCDTDLSETPFLVPGLHSGVTLLTPWGRLDILIQGGGRIDFRARANVPGLSSPTGGGLQVETLGRYDPSTGVAISRVTPSVEVNLYNRGVVAPELNRLNIGPASVRVGADVFTAQENAGQATIELNTYDHGAATMH